MNDTRTSINQIQERWKMRVRGIIACMILPVLLGAGRAEAAFKDSGWGVRPLGMGGAFTAVANDANAPTFNPAGVAQLTKHEFSFMSARLFTGVEGVDIGQNYFSFILPVNEKTGNFGFSWTSLSSPDLYREDAGNISYGRYLDDLFQIGNMNLFLGANAKYLRHEYSLDVRSKTDPVFANGNSAGAFTGDFGLLALLPDSGISFGIASKNITSPDVGLKTADPVYNENVAGIAYYSEKAPIFSLPYFTFAVDVVNRNKDMDYRAGVESWFFDGKFAVRAGGRMQELTLGLGYEFRLGETKLVLDYALAWPLEVENTIGSHRLGLTLRLP